MDLPYSNRLPAVSKNSLLHFPLKLFLMRSVDTLCMDELQKQTELRGKVVWVTGASSGIGEELAYQLSKIGAFLAISARREDELERVKKKCLRNTLTEKDILVLRLDLTDRSSHEAATNSVIKHFGKIDVLVNNGGRSQRSLFMDTNLDVYSAIMELNYLGTISLTKHVLKHMIERKRGKIVTVSSVMGIMGAPLASGYCASKHALQGFFNSLRTELTDYPEISIINICPGPVQSKIIQNVFTENLAKVRTLNSIVLKPTFCYSHPFVVSFSFAPSRKHKPRLLTKKCFD
uniref:Dehydrogenase/reductase SDR family member 7 n=1 Tax=Anas zonorhyncha TaxID=75864 RepID=A0A8B9UEQ2_9AVES